MDLVEQARKIATFAHKDQKRKFSDEPFINHPKRVASNFTDPYFAAVAWLHDVLEDTDFTSRELLDLGIPYEVVKSVEILTHDKSQLSYLNYIFQIIQYPDLALIKAMDVQDNLRDLKDGTLKDKYELAYFILGSCVARDFNGGQY